MKGWLTYSSSKVFWLSIIFGFPIVFWLWAIGTKLTKKLPSNVKMNVGLFKIIMLYPIVYIVFALFYLIIKGDFILPLHFAAMGAFLYSMLFAAKALKSIELQKEALVSDYLGDFFLIWFYPIGIWLLQPRIHDIVYEKEKAHTANNGYS